VALLAGFCAEAEAPRLRDRRLMRVLLGVGAVLLAGGAAGAWSAPAIGVTLLTLGAGLLLAAGVSLRGRALGWPGVLVAGLGAGAAAGTLTGLLGNPNPALKAFLGEPAVAEALAGPVPMLGDLGKPGVLIRAYGPLPVPILTDAAALVPGALLWIDPDAPPARPFETLAETEGAALVRLGG
jgi:hypothetical protein